jgi:ubiquinone/menaquinone biosynthesis C-methylase UbiE
MLAKASQAMVEAGLANVTLVRGDGNRLPLADGSLDLAVCGYSLHHFADPAQPLREMVRAVCRGGRVGVADIYVPEGCDPDANNRVERARDVSHCTTLTVLQLRRMFHDAGLMLCATETDERQRDFDDWMRNVSREPGSPVYEATRALLEAHIGHDATGFRPRWKTAAGGAIEFVQRSFFIVGEKH